MMKQIKLIKISYHNFKGIHDFSIEPDGQNINISGKNAVGKTSLFDGFLWLLFGKNSSELSKFNPKPLDESGNEVLGLEPEVEATLEIDGKDTTLRRKLAEVWAKPRGQAEKVRKSDRTELYIDEVPNKLKDYTAFVDSLIDENTFKLLTNPTAFNNLKWQDRRQILMSLIDDVNDDSVISETSHPDELKKMLGDHSVADQRKIIAAQRRQLKIEIDGVPSRIDEATRAIPETSSTSKEVLEEMLKTYHEQLNEEQANLQAVSGSNSSLDARNKKMELESELNSKQASHQAGSQIATSNLANDLNNIKLKHNNAVSELRLDQQVIDQLTHTIEVDEDTRSKLLTQYHELKDQQFDESSLTCPTCGREYPEEQQAKLKATFNINRSKQMEEIVANGKSVKDRIEDTQAKLATKKKSNSNGDKPKLISMLNSKPNCNRNTIRKRLQLHRLKKPLPTET